MSSGRASDEVHVSAETCLEAARRGDGEALGALLERFRARFNRLAERQLGAAPRLKVSHSDVVQETFAQACASLPAFRGSTRAEFEAWLLGILGHRLANLQRHYARTAKRGFGKEAIFGVDSAAARLLESFPAQTTPPSERARRHERSQALGEAIAQLPDHYQQIIGWRLRDELTFEQIGSRLSKSPDAIRQSYYRALKALKANLGEGHDPN